MLLVKGVDFTLLDEPIDVYTFLIHAVLLVMGMDRIIKKRYWTISRLLMLTGIFAILSFSIYAFTFMDMGSTLRVDMNRLTIAEVRESLFQNSFRTNGTVQPIETTFLDAIEGGVIQKVYRETGEFIEKGDTIVTLTNSTLQLQVLQQTSGLYDQINNVRNSRLNIEQNTLRLQEQLADAKAQMEILKAKYSRQKKLIQNGLIAEEEFQVTEKKYLYQKKRYELTRESFQKDSLQSLTQLTQLSDSEERMYQNLEAVQQIIDNLVITAPISGQLSTQDLNQGQAIAPGEKIGQIDILDHYKVRSKIDEYHLENIHTGLYGTFEFAGNTHQLMITKVYPIVVNGTFMIDLEFMSESPVGLRRGQSLRIRLELSDSKNALQLKRGGFIQNTGGNWVFVVNEEEGKAYKRPIKLGLSNEEYYEILSGLEAGEKVIVSSYDAFGENDILVLE